MLILPGILDTQTKIPVSKRGSYVISIPASDPAAKYILPFSRKFAHYIGFMLAAHIGQNGLIVRINRVSTMALL